MTNKEMLILLSGTNEHKQQLFNYFTDKFVQGGVIENNEQSFFEAVKKELFPEQDLSPEQEVVTMSASIQGASGVSDV